MNAADAQAYVRAFPSFRNISQRYNSAADANGNSFVGIGDGRLLLRNSTPPAPRVPLSIEMHLAPGDQITWDGPKNSGGVAVNKNVTILGHTTPGALVFDDEGLGDYSFRGKSFVADAQGNFRVPVTLSEGLNNFNFLAIDSYGQQAIRAFPIYWVPFAAGKVD